MKVESAERLSGDTGRLLAALGAAGRFDGSNPPFSVIHFGEHSVVVADALAAISPFATSAPRSGHIGDWTAIAMGRAGALDFNYSVIANGYGHASIHALTMTETDAEGDRVYCPASVRHEGVRFRLPLRSWNGHRFEDRTGTSLFSPFVMTSWDKHDVPLIQLHKSRMAVHAEMRFKYEVDVLLDHERELKEGLTTLLAAAAESKSRFLLDSIVRACVRLDGSMIGGKLVCDSGVFQIGDVVLGSAADVADRMAMLFRTVAEPSSFFSNIRQLPTIFPVISNLALSLFTANFTAISVDGLPYRLHLHWGARHMAGFPPYSRGYLCESGTLRRLSRMSNILQDRCGWVGDLRFVLLPAPIFMLAPLSDDRDDIAMIDELIQIVDAQQTGSPDRGGSITELVENWVERCRSSLSKYFVARFRNGAGLYSQIECNRRGLPILPEKFGSLPISTACQIVGALNLAIGARV
ncbi:DUF6025 family protein [Ensifer adhaerens]|uniref:DUF6025 family protein n=1 Tax=Ensifer adhaerens TaxID=106592 RepID=UPI003D06E2B9